MQTQAKTDTWDEPPVDTDKDRVDRIFDIAAVGEVAERLRAEVDIQVATAKRFPRTQSAWMARARTLALENPTVAGECYYRLPRAGKTIEGPSIRLAEIIAACYGNLRTWTSIVEPTPDATSVMTIATAHDLEVNWSAQEEVRRRIIDRKGRRYSEDMVNNTANAGRSIALRNALFRVVPRVLVNKLVQECKSAALGKGTLEERRQRCLRSFGELGASEQEVCLLGGKRRVEDIDVDALTDLWGLYTAIKLERCTTLQDELERVRRPEGDDDAPSRLASALKKGEKDAQNE